MEKLDLNKKQPKTSGLIQLLMVVGVILIVIDILQLSYQVNPNGQAGWQLTVAPSIKATTIVLALILCLPILLPLINRVISEGYIRRLTGTLRNEGIEEIETNTLRIKLSADATQSAEAYERKVLSETETADVSNPIEYQATFERAYSEVTTLAQRSNAISSEQALEFINELANYYDEIRENLPGGSGRTTLMTRIASLIWSIIPSIQQFPIEKYIVSRSGGKRLAAYKYLEWQPDPAYLNELLVRALGVLETPFGQYSALNALQRLITATTLTEGQSRTVLVNLKWHSKQRHLAYGQDRVQKMRAIIATLESGLTSNTQEAG
jgi:hypothetical protein